MSLIDRYIAEVGRHLPEKDRADIEAEIRSMVDDMIDEHGQSAVSNEKVVVDTLEELGDPKSLAFKYAPPKRYLIGPAWYELYTVVLRRVLFTALPIVAAIMFVLNLTQNPIDFIHAIGEAVGSVIGVGIQILFWVTAAFVFLERSEEKPAEVHRSGSQAWTVAQLPKLPRKRQISIGEALTDIAMELFVILWILLPPIQNWLRGDPELVPFFHPGLWPLWFAIFLVLMVLNLTHDVIKLRVGNWTSALTITNVILCTGWIIYIVALVTTQEVINPAFLATLSNTSEMARLQEVASWSVNISAVVVIGICIWDIVNSVRLARQLKQTYHLSGLAEKSFGGRSMK
jgi:hypothetical protein